MERQQIVFLAAHARIPTRSRPRFMLRSSEAFGLLLTVPSIIKNTEALDIFMAVKEAPSTSATSARRKPPHPDIASAPLMLRASQVPEGATVNPRESKRRPTTARISARTMPRRRVGRLEGAAAGAGGSRAPSQERAAVGAVAEAGGTRARRRRRSGRHKGATA